MNISKYSKNVLTIANPKQDLKQLHLSLNNDLRRLYDLCYFLDKAPTKYYYLYWNINLILAYLQNVELKLMELVALEFMEIQFKYTKQHKKYKKIHRKYFKELKKSYRIYEKEFTKTEKKISKIYSKMLKEEKKKRICSLNMNTVYSGIAENEYKKLCSVNHNKLTSLVEGVAPVGVTPQEEEVVKEMLMSRI